MQVLLQSLPAHHKSDDTLASLLQKPTDLCLQAGMNRSNIELELSSVIYSNRHACFPCALQAAGWAHALQATGWACALQATGWACALQAAGWACALQAAGWARALQAIQTGHVHSRLQAGLECRAEVNHNVRLKAEASRNLYTYTQTVIMKIQCHVM